MTKIKFCGLTREEDVTNAVNLGVDYVGFNFFSGSSRYVTPERAGKLAESLPPTIKAIGVFVNAPRAEIETILAQVPLSGLQFHGDESAEDLAGWKEELIIRAVRLGDAEDEQRIGEAAKSAGYLLFDRLQSGQYGGTGAQIEDDALEAAFSLAIAKPVFLAGGLTPENVAEKARRFKPFAVDVAGGIENAPGQKSLEKMKAFIQAVRQA